MNPKEILSRPPFGNPMSRRSMLRGSLFAAGGLTLGSSLLSACGSSDSSSAASGGNGGGGQVVVADWGGAIQDAEQKYLYGPFSKETGIKVVMSGPPADARIKAMVDSGNVEWDLVAGSLTSVIALGRSYFEELPSSTLTVPGVDKKYIDKQAVAYYVFSTNMGWNTDMMAGKKLETWADFWNTSSFPGKRTLAGTDGGSYPQLEFALLADGVAMADLYPLDVDRAFAKMAELKPSVPQWWSSGAQPGQMMVSKQVSAASIWSGRVLTLQGQGAPIDMNWAGGMYEPAHWVVPKGAPNKDNAFKLIEYSLQPEVQAKLWGNYPEGPTNSKAFDSITAKQAKLLPTNPQWADSQFLMDSAWWGANEDDVFKKWNAFVLS
jgi:putative spermidine/putrescine transport system substrate-binding protein